MTRLQIQKHPYLLSLSVATHFSSIKLHSASMITKLATKPRLFPPSNPSVKIKDIRLEVSSLLYREMDLRKKIKFKSPSMESLAK